MLLFALSGLGYVTNVFVVLSRDHDELRVRQILCRCHNQCNMQVYVGQQGQQVYYTEDAPMICYVWCMYGMNAMRRMRTGEDGFADREKYKGCKKHDGRRWVHSPSPFKFAGKELI